MQEPFRWLSDISVIEAFESEALKLSDFYFTGDDYRYRFEPDARHRFIEVLREKFNSGASYKDRNMKWDTLIQEKTSELGRYLSSRSRVLDFSDPPFALAMADYRATREKILRLTQSEARKRGIGKSTLHYLRKRASEPSSFSAYRRVYERLNNSVITSDLFYDDWKVMQPWPQVSRSKAY